MTPIAKLIESVLVPIAQPAKTIDVPYATHQGVLSLAGVDLNVYRLSDGRAIVDAADLNQFFA